MPITRVYLAVTATPSNSDSFPRFYFFSLTHSNIKNKQPVTSYAFTPPLSKAPDHFPLVFCLCCKTQVHSCFSFCYFFPHLLPLLLQSCLLCLPQLFISPLDFFLGVTLVQFSMQGEMSLLLNAHCCLHFDKICWPDKESLYWIR